MIIVEDYRGCYGDALERYYNFEDFSDGSDNKVLFHGMGTVETPECKAQYKGYDKKAFWNLEQPAAWYGGDKNYMVTSANIDKYFQKIMTICPYTSEWLNSMHNSDVFVPSFMPFGERHVHHGKEDKIYDVIYWGHISSQTHLNFIDAMKSFKYNFLSLGLDYWHQEFRNSGHGEYITAVNLPREDMWSLLRKTKICLITNCAYLTDQQIKNVKSIKGWKQCGAFSHIDQGSVPQYKTRMIESAVNRTLMLVKRNPWKVDEMWFEPGKDFIYFEKDEELPNLIEHITTNWHQYESIVENAFVKATTRYTVKNFINLVKENLDD
tara:strand:+ start:106 stop:1074 length:969 start_codon:yes stop_codon:yes gene_type:complete